jgi:hypothetical protein
MAELHPNLEQKELEAPEEQDLLEAGASQEHAEQPATEAERLATMAQSAREAVEKHVTSTEEIRLNNPEQPDVERSDFQLTKTLKDEKYVHTLVQTQTQLKGPEKSFSKLIHRPSVERFSNLAADTVARPSGILGGASGALVGSLIVLLSAKHYGFAYNFLLFLFLFAGGFALGLVVELAYNFLHKRRS